MNEAASDKPEGESNFLNPENLNPKNVLKQVDATVYKQLFLFIGIALVVASVFYVFLRISQEPDTSRLKNTNQSETAQVDQGTKEKITEDQQRKNDVVIINSALKSYFISNKKAPDVLDKLVPDSLAQLPTDPKTKEKYTYTPSQSFDAWVVSTKLSDGKTFEAKGP